MSALIGWTDHAQNGTITNAAEPDWIMDASNMLLPGAPSRARWDDADPLVFVLDLGNVKRIDALVFLGVNARLQWNISIALGSSAPGDQDDPDMIGWAYSTLRPIPWGATPILAFTETRYARYISISADWDIGSDGYYDIRRLLALECVRLRGVSVQSSMTGEGSGEAIVSQGGSASIEQGVHWRNWSLVLNNLTFEQMHGNHEAAGFDPALNDLCAKWSNLGEVLMIPRTDNAHMIASTAIVGRVTGPIQVPGRARSGKQWIQFQMSELLHAKEYTT